MCPKEGILVAWDDVSISLCLHVCHIVSFVWEPERLHWKTPAEGSRMLRLVAHPCGSHPSQLCRAARRIAGAGLGVGASSSSTACLRKGHQRHPKIRGMIIIDNFFSIFFIAIIQKLPFGHAHLAACGGIRILSHASEAARSEWPEAGCFRDLWWVVLEHHGSHTVPFGHVWKWGIPQMAIEMHLNGEHDFLIHWNCFFLIFLTHPFGKPQLLPFPLTILGLIRHAVKLWTLWGR